MVRWVTDPRSGGLPTHDLLGCGALSSETPRAADDLGMKKSDRSKVSAGSSAAKPDAGKAGDEDRAADADRSPLSPGVCLHEVARLCQRALPRKLRLLPGLRMSLAAYIFLEAPRLVRAVAEAIEENPALFADLPVDPALMRLQQRRGLSYQSLYFLLLDLAELAKDGYLRDQSDATQAALLVVRCVRAEALRPVRTAGTEARIDLMMRAERILAGRQQRKQKSGQRNKKLAAAPVKVPKKPRKPPQQRAMEEVRKADLDQIAAEVAQNMSARRKKTS